MWSKFFSIDVRALALFRITIGLLLLCDLFNRGLHLEAFYTDLGVLPRGPYLSEFANASHWSLHLFSGEFYWQALLFIIHAIFALSLTLGYQTRISCFVCWVLLVSLHSRNPVVLQGGDVLFRQLYFFAIFLPLNVRFSIDSALHPNLNWYSSSFTSIATAGLLMQTASVYFFTAILKMDPHWFDGTAVYYAIHLDIFTTPLGNFIRELDWSHSSLTYGTLGWEFLGVFLVFSPYGNLSVLRLLSITLFTLMHLGFFFSMELGLFPFISICSWIPFLPASFFNYFRSWTSKVLQDDVRIYFDADCGFCKKGVHLVREFAFPRDLPIKEAQSDPEIHEQMLEQNSWVIQIQNQNYFHFNAFVQLCQYSVVLRFFTPIFRFFPVFWLGTRAYKLVASNRKKFSFLTRGLKWTNWSFKNSTPAMIFCAVCIVYMSVWNIRSIDFKRYEKFFPTSANWFGMIARVDQYWSMFAPYPLKDDGWYVIPARLSDGTEFDLWRMHRPVDWNKPELVSSTFESQRWRKYMVNLWDKKYSKHRLYYGKYLCRTWSLKYPNEKPLKSFQIYFVKETTLPPGGEFREEKVLLWDHYCYK